MTIDHPPPAKSRTGLIAVLVLFVAFLSLAIGFGVGMLTGNLWKPQPKSTTLDQVGQVSIVAGQEGVVNFPIPYSSPPNVELDASGFSKTAITECTATGFKWKNTGTDDTWNNGKVRWTARGLK